MKKIIISSLLSSMIISTSLSAFDEQKEGFLVSLGAGIGTVKTSVELGSLGANETDFSFNTSFKIGYGFTNQFLLYYINDVSWFKYDDDPKDDTYLSGITGIGASYYMHENSPFYIMGGIGLGSYTNFTENEGERGTAIIVGAGYEISPHFQIEASYLTTKIEENNIELTTDAFRVTVNYMWY